MVKSGSGMDYWRGYFGSSNGDIFEIIEKAIIVAALDYPKEFRIRRDDIAQTLFACRLIKCSGCDKVELGLPGEDDDDDDGKGVKSKSESANVDGNDSKGSNKEISSCRDDNDNDIDDDDGDDHKASNYSYGVAEALTDEIEEESQMFGEVMRIKEIVDNNQDESESVLYNSLRKLQLMALSVETLKATEIGKSVNVLRKHASKDVSHIAKTLIEAWKDMVDQWVVAIEKTTPVSEATPESLNPSVLDEEEEGLPSPPLDDLAFFYPHASLELSEFFDGMEEYGNPGNKNCNNGRTRKQQKPSTVVHKKELQEGGTIVKKKQAGDMKPVKGSVAPKPNTERKLQTVPKRRPHQSNATAAGEGTGVAQDKFEATKRKLQERYQQAEKAKKQRTIQVMELHDLPKAKQSFPHQNVRAGSNHNRRR